jgi:hypothetical protein
MIMLSMLGMNRKCPKQRFGFVAGFDHQGQGQGHHILQYHHDPHKLQGEEYSVDEVFVRQHRDIIP